MTIRVLQTIAIAAGMVCALSAASSAQQYPTREVKLVVGFPPGGGIDVQARLFAEYFGQALNQTVLIDNRPGVDAVLATRFVAKAAADGYTVLFGATNMATNLIGLKEPGYTWDDFTLIGGITYAPAVLIANTASSKAKTLKELIAFGKANPGTLTFASNGPQSSPTLMSRRLDLASNIGWREIPYKGSAQIMQDMMGGRVDTFFGLPSTALAAVNQPDIAILAVTDTKRFLSLPNVPTFAEQGFPTIDDVYMSGIWVAATTPKPVQEKLRLALTETLKSPGFKERLEKTGNLLYSGTPAEFDAAMKKVEASYRDDFKRFSIEPQ
jgi:tripartite-type tricarboxylate transporter receptor subunit TctC